LLMGAILEGLGHKGLAPQIPAPESTMSKTLGKPLSGWRLRLYTVVFEADTRAGRLFDEILLVAIILSVAVVMLDSVETVRLRGGGVFDVLEWCFTGLFTFEYLLRLSCVRRPIAYATSFFGIIDLLSILPSYLALFVPGAEVLVDVRILRLLRVFRIFKLANYVSEYTMLGQALKASMRKILVFLSVVVMVVLVMGSVMYLVEGPGNGFTSIPTAMYWAVSTMTTVGFGDITPKTDLGRFISSLMMMLGWGVLAVPTGIVTAEMSAQSRYRKATTTRTCHHCLTEGHLPDARYCFKCGTTLPKYHRDEEASST
jgi:voltage-gated potassium channel